MALPPTLTAFLRDNSTTLLGALLLVNFLLLLGFVWVLARMGKLARLYARLTRGTSGGNLEEILHGYMGTVTDVAQRMEAMEGTVARLGDNQQHCLQKVGLVRFDAFEEVGGEQSFAVAMLDAQHTGVVLSSVYSRADVRVYAKSVRDGQPSHPLTQEEQRALAQTEGK
jgi:hypothetical protein